MKITMDRFKEVLGDIGVLHHDRNNYLALQECPSCGDNRYKVYIYFDYDVPRGRCTRGSCDKGYTPLSYLMDRGMEEGEARSRLGLDVLDNLKSLFQTSTTIEKIEELTVVPEVSTESFLDVDPETYVGRYAIGRGYTDFYKDIIKMDLEENAVVFLVKRDGKTIGYQKRFVSPHADPKTRTSKGFQRVCMMFPAQKSQGVLVCEGPFTALSGSHFGFDSLCTFGAGLSPIQIKEIAATARNGVIYYAKDNDEAGDKGLYKFVMAMRWYNLKILVVEPGYGKDLNDAWKKGAGYRVKECEIDPWIPRLEIMI